jgi:hypothetical protein
MDDYDCDFDYDYDYDYDDATTQRHQRLGLKTSEGHAGGYVDSPR